MRSVCCIHSCNKKSLQYTHTSPYTQHTHQVVHLAGVCQIVKKSYVNQSFTFIYTKLFLKKDSKTVLVQDWYAPILLVLYVDYCTVIAKNTKNLILWCICFK